MKRILFALGVAIAFVLGIGFLTFLPAYLVIKVFGLPNTWGFIASLSWAFFWVIFFVTYFTEE